MQDDVNWKLSLLLDDELDTKEAIQLLEQIHQNPDLFDKWCGYNSLSQVMRYGGGIQPNQAFLDRIRFSLDSEPTLTSNPGHSSKPSSVPINRYLIPLALAASLSIVAVIASKQWQTRTDAAPAMTAQTAATTLPPPSRLATASVTHSNSQTKLDDQPDPRVNLTSNRQNSRFEDYLIAHSESSLDSASPQGVLSYARIVSHGGN